MHRRLFCATLLAVAAAPAAFAGDTADYEPGLIQEALAEGRTVFVDFAADWCSTCARQERVIADLRAANPAYDEAMLFVRVDWDAYKRHEVTTSRGIPRRSTLLLLKGDEELGRLVAETRPDQIQALLDTGLQAGS